MLVGQLGRPHTAAPTRLHILCFGPSFCIRPHSGPYVVRSTKGDRDPLFHPACADDHARERMVGTAGFEPATSASRTLRATKLRYVPPAGIPAGE